MKTLFLGQLSNGISIDSYLDKHPVHKEYEILYITEDGQYRIRKNNNDTAISFNIEYFKSLVYITNSQVTSIDTTKDSIVMIPHTNVVSYTNINREDTNIYIPIEKSIVIILGHYGTETVDITSIIKNVNNHCSLKINNEDFTFNKIEVDYHSVDIIPDSIDIVFSNNRSHFINFNNPHNVTKKQLGLENVDNTSDSDKDLSNAMITALDQFKFNFDKAISEYKAVIPNEVSKIKEDYENILNQIIDSRLTAIDDSIINCNKETKSIIELKNTIKSSTDTFILNCTNERNSLKSDIDNALSDMKVQLENVINAYISTNDNIKLVISQYEVKYNDVLKNIEKLSSRMHEITRTITLSK